jgi:AraC-like DNA-binding protein
VSERGISDDQPSVTVAEITDPAIAGQDLELADLDTLQLPSTVPFRARRVVVRFEAGAVVYHSTNHRIRARTRALGGRLAFLTYGRRTTGTVNGLAIHPELVVAVEPETEIVIVTDVGYESITLLVPPSEVHAHLRDRGREADFLSPKGAVPLRADGARVCRLFNWGKKLVDMAARQPALFDDRKDQRDAALVEMIETLLATLGTATDAQPTRAGHARQSQTLVVKAAEDYALSHAHDRVYVSDLCRAAGVSERALEYAFKDVMGLTPIAYLVRLRLHRARQALLVGTHGTTTVSAVALDWGFWHFGDFSRAYKDCFGELPSDTLRRKPSAAER